MPNPNLQNNKKLSAGFLHPELRVLKFIKAESLGEGVRVKNRNFRCKNPKTYKIFGYLHLKLLIPDLAADIRQVAGIFGTRNSRCKTPNIFSILDFYI